MNYIISEELREEILDALDHGAVFQKVGALTPVQSGGVVTRSEFDEALNTFAMQDGPWSDNAAEKLWTWVCGNNAAPIPQPEARGVEELEQALREWWDSNPLPSSDYGYESRYWGPVARFVIAYLQQAPQDYHDIPDDQLIGILTARWKMKSDFKAYAGPFIFAMQAQAPQGVDLKVIESALRFIADRHDTPIIQKNEAQKALLSVRKIPQVVVVCCATCAFRGMKASEDGFHHCQKFSVDSDKACFGNGYRHWSPAPVRVDDPSHCPGCGTFIMANGYGAHHSESCKYLNHNFNQVADHE